MKYRVETFCEMLGLCDVTPIGLAFDPIPAPYIPPLETDTYTVYLNHNPSGVSASFDPMLGPVCSLIRGSFSAMVPGNATNCSIYYPKWAMTISAEATFSIMQNGDIVFTESWWEPGRDVCDLFAKIICCDRDYYTCMFLYSPWWWLGFVLAIIILLCLLCPCLFTMFVTLLYFVVYPLLWLVKGSWLCLRKAGRRQSIPVAKYVAVFFLPLALACSQSGHITVPLGSCTINGGTYICSTILSTTFTLPYIGATACFDIEGEGNIGVYGVFGQANFTFVRESITVLTQRLYYTGYWDLYTESSKRCYNAGECTTHNCDTLNSTADYDAYGELDNPIVLGWPGRTYCDASCGCAGCGCFYCNDGCLFSRFAIVPHNTSVYSVEQAIALVREPVISYSIFDGVSTHTGEITMSSPTTSDAFLSMSVVGSLSENPTFFGTNKFIFDTSSSQAWYGPACEQNIPVIGSLGDLQAESGAYPLTESRVAFNFDFQSVTHSTGQNKATYVVSSNGARHLPSLPQFHMVIGFYYLSATDGLITGHSSTPSTTVVNMLSLDTVTITSVVTQVCPEISALNGTGCYDCGTPATVYVNMRATCTPGYLRITSSSGNVTVATSSVYATFYNEHLPIQVYVFERYVSFTLAFFDSTNVARYVDFSFEAVEFVNVNTDEITTPVDTDTDQTPDGYKLDFLGGLGLPRWLSCTLDVIIVIIGASLVILLLFLIFYGIYKCIKNKKAKQL